MTAHTVETKVDDIHLRMRRMETRLTKYLESIGFDTGCQRARWVSLGFVEVPSPACALKEILDLIPADWLDDVDVIHQGKKIATLSNWA